MGFYQHTQDSKNNQWGFNHEIEFQKTIEFGDWVGNPWLKVATWTEKRRDYHCFSDYIEVQVLGVYHISVQTHITRIGETTTTTTTTTTLDSH